MNKQQALRILGYAEIPGYKITKIYLNGFKAIRSNEWCKTELYCEIFCDPDKIEQYINADTVFQYASIATMQIERYK